MTVRTPCLEIHADVSRTVVHIHVRIMTSSKNVQHSVYITKLLFVTCLPSHQRTRVYRVPQGMYIIFQSPQLNRPLHFQDLFSEWLEGESTGDCNR